MNELLTVPPVQIGAWLACLAFTVMLANGLVKLWAERNGQTLRDIVDANNQTLRDLILTENAKIYNRINEVAKGFYTLNGKVDALLSREHRTRTDNEDHA